MTKSELLDTAIMLRDGLRQLRRRSAVSLESLGFNADMETGDPPKTLEDIMVTLYNTRGGYQAQVVVKNCPDGYVPPIIIYKGMHFCCLQSADNKYRRTFTAEGISG